jgi:hypothetical protein
MLGSRIDRYDPVTGFIEVPGQVGGHIPGTENNNFSVFGRSDNQIG